MYSKSEKIIGYHGTYLENVPSIIANNFQESKEEIWLGTGVYFFIEGVGFQKPCEYAKLFAIDNCWSKDKKTYMKSHYCILQATIKINNDRFLDLTDIKGNFLFNQFRHELINNIKFIGKIPTAQYKDSDVLKLMRDALGIEFVKSNVYIRFAKQRIGLMESRVPNVTILVVNNPVKNIPKPSIKEIDKGEIK